MKKHVFAAVLFLGVSSMVWADNTQPPAGGNDSCRGKIQAQHQARQTLHGCLDNWARYQGSAPSDNCSSQLGSFTQAATAAESCHAKMKEMHEKRQEKMQQGGTH